MVSPEVLAVPAWWAMAMIGIAIVQTMRSAPNPHLAFSATPRPPGANETSAQKRRSRDGCLPEEGNWRGSQRTPAKLASQRWMMPVVTLLLLTGCTAEDSAVPLPTAAKSPSVSPPQSDAEPIKRSYIAFIAILDRADSLPTGTRRQELAFHMTDPQLTRVIDRIKEMEEENLTSYGKVVAHVQDIHVKDTDATLRDCQDSRDAGTMNALTGKKINRGIEKENLKTYLSKGPDGRWRVTKTVSYGKGC
ncbi:hypothetical protein ETD83_26715 [Actinomadura soli]|uniref:Uncharacterized protein n=1 Tax=Actinomadura soli TaxID=2508997 RepID=A0A5C4J8H2_9ACTN|nr:hypothetical protein [Actinomadura soli]TMQ92736.1 hypothetical protein ETD83_26715 [Actinomadura soli]